MRTDVNAFLGSYPYRRVPGTSPEALLEAMDRTGIDEAWVSHLPGIFWRDPGAGNNWLLETAREMVVASLQNSSSLLASLGAGDESTE